MPSRSIPITLGAAKGGQPRLRTTRSNVSLLTGSISRRAKTRRWAATQGKPKVMDNKVEPGCSPRPRCQSAVVKALGKNASIAKNRIAAEAARHNHKPNLPSRQRQIGETSLIPAMDLPGMGSASGTETRVACGTDGNHGRDAVAEGALHVKPARDQG
jgi:hypothetical protein